MVKLNWLEKGVIYFLVLAGIFYIRNNVLFDTGVSGYFAKSIIYLIIAIILGNIIIKVIMGKDSSKKSIGEWWKKQKPYEKILITLAILAILYLFIRSMFFT